MEEEERRELVYPSVMKWCGDSAWSLVGLHVHFGVASGATYPGGIQLPCPVSHVHCVLCAINGYL